MSRGNPPLNSFICWIRLIPCGIILFNVHFLVFYKSRRNERKSLAGTLIDTAKINISPAKMIDFLLIELIKSPGKIINFFKATNFHFEIK